MGRAARFKGCQHRSWLGYAAGRGCGDDQAGSAHGYYAGPDYGGGNTRGCAGRRYEGGGFQRSRRYDRLYGHGYGYECRRRHERTEPVCHGTAATAAGAAGSGGPGSSGGGRLEMCLRGYGQRQFLPELRRKEARAAAGGRRLEV